MADITTSSYIAGKRPRFKSRNATVFACLLLFSSNFLPISISTAVLVAVGTLASLMGAIDVAEKGKISWERAIWVATAFYLLPIAIISRGEAVSNFVWLTEAKVVALPIVAFGISSIPSLRKGGQKTIKSVSIFLLALNIAALAASGFEFRYIDKYGAAFATISIYMSVIIAPMVVADRSWVRRFIFLILMGMLGSSTGFVALIALIVWLNRSSLYQFWRGRWLIIVLVMAALVSMFYWYNLEFRGRDIFDLASIDRFQLASAAFLFSFENMTIKSALIGFGVGVELLNASQFFSEGATVLPWLLRGFGIDGFTGRLYHNEFFRIFFNFGIIGLILVFWSIKRSLIYSPALFAALIAASMFNSTVYIFAIIIPYLVYAKIGVLKGR